MPRRAVLVSVAAFVLAACGGSSTPSMDVPTAVTAVVVPAATIEPTATVIPSPKFAPMIAAESGHFIQTTQPELVIEAIRKLVEEQRG